MGHLDFGTMQRLNIEAARKHAGQPELVTPSGPPTGGGAGGGGNGGGVTPISLNTPDILNSILNINPFFIENPSTTTSTSTSNHGSCSVQPDSLAGTPEEQEKKVFANLESPLSGSSSSLATGAPSVTNRLGAASTSSSSTIQLPSMSSMVASPISHEPPSVELTRSKLIKESLKHSIQSKRKNSGKGELDVMSELVVKHRKREEVLASSNNSSTASSAFLNLCYPSSSSASSPDFHTITTTTTIQAAVDLSNTELPYKLTPEDEERRRRRRERNKVAATKCRNKKKEKTLLLIQESESLEGNNVSLKSEISKLESERQQLMDVLAQHAPVCSRVGGSSNLSSDNRGGSSGGGGGNPGGSGGNGSRSLNSMISSSQFSSGHHNVGGCYSTGHHSHIHGGGLPHHNSYYNNASIQLS